MKMSVRGTQCCWRGQPHKSPSERKQKTKWKTQDRGLEVKMVQKAPRVSSTNSLTGSCVQEKEKKDDFRTKCV